MQLIYTHEVIQHKLDQATERLAVEASLYDTIGTKEVIQSAYEELTSIQEQVTFEGVKKIMVEEVVNFLGAELLRNYFLDSLEDTSFKPGIIVNGIQGIDFANSSFMLEDDVIKGVITYKAVPLFHWFHTLEFDVIQVSSCKAWTGYGRDEKIEDIVYKTINGSVYHTINTCTYIKFDVRECIYSMLTGQEPCKSCAQGLSFLPEQIVYTTRTGDKFHSTKECKRIKRDIIEIKKSEIGDLRPCSRCGGLEVE